MTTAINVFQALILILGAPLVSGIVGKIKAWIQRRQGATIWRPYAEIAKLFRKEDLVPPTASWVFRFAPKVLFATTVCAVAFIPMIQPTALLASRGDFFLLVYLLALGRFFLSLGAMDGGSAFGGMGASRDALVSTLAEAPFLLGLAAVSILAAHADIAGMVMWTLRRNILEFSAVHILAFTSLAMVVLAETGRMPVDNPTTHLELTMIHEGMVLEYSGPSLALVEWAKAIKLHAMLVLLISLFGPWGMASTLSVWGTAIALMSYLVKVTVLLILLALVESVVAKLRMYLVPDFLGVASAVSALAVIFTTLVKR